MDRKQKLTLGYILMGLGGIITIVALFNIPMGNIIAILIGSSIGYLGYKIRLANR